MKKQLILVIIFFLLINSCKDKLPQKNIEKWKSEIVDVEKAFNDMAQKEGLVKAFYFYSADDGAIRRGKKVITGKNAIKQWYEKDVKPNETLSWTPTFVDVSTSGDMAYTYGNYIFTSTDSLGIKKESKGIFHTVWKRQSDGSWRFVWD